MNFERGDEWMQKQNLHLAACICGQDEEYQRPLLEGLTEACIARNIKLSVFLACSELHWKDSAKHHATEIFTIINFEKLDGLVIFPMGTDNTALLQDLISRAKAHKIPVICVDDTIDDCWCIQTLDAGALELLVSHLMMTHGTKRPCFLGTAHSPAETVFRQTTERQNCTAATVWSLPETGFTAQWLQAQLSASGDRPEAFVCETDDLAIQTIRALRTLHIQVPANVFVTGFGSTRRGLRFCPAITTTAADFSAAGEKIATRFLEIRKGSCPAAGNERMPAVPMLLESCGCPKLASSAIADRLFDELDLHSAYLLWGKHSIEELSCHADIDELIQRLTEVAQHFRTDKCWFCICDNYFESEADSGMGDGFTETMQPLVFCRGQQPEQLERFSLRDMLPQLEREWDDTGAILYAPLYVSSRVIGYIAVAYTSIDLPLEMLGNLACTISVVLENARTRLQLEKMVERCQKLAVQDPMTGLYNRRGFYTQMSPVFDQCVKERQPFMAIAIDLDGLKEINDKFGHQEGDYAVQVLAKHLQEAAVDGHIAARFSGDEFVIAGKFCVTRHPEQILHTLDCALREYNTAAGQRYAVAMICGWYQEIPNEDSYLDDWIAIANERMNSEKKIRKNRVRTRK